jgi:peptidoglycan/xylan/chitin deacetylase (PgdA/CDA1 family)
MKSIIKKIILQAICYLRLPKLLSVTTTRNSISIVTYHAVVDKPLSVYDWCFLSETLFRKQIQYLKKRFCLLSLSEAVDRIEKGKIDKPSAVVTFDDGFQNNYDIAFPILREADIPATIFLSTNYVNSKSTLWFCELNHAFEKTESDTLNWGGDVYKIKNKNEKVYASALIQEKLKRYTHSKLLKETEKIIRRIGGDSDLEISIGSPYRMLEIDSINTMTQSGLIEFGAHTHNHSILAKLSREDKLKEIGKSIQKVEFLTKQPCFYFSYPNGGENDYDNECIDILKKHDVKAAVTMVPGPNDSDTPLMHLKRYGIGGKTNIPDLQVLVHHLRWKYKNYLNKV